MDDFREPGPRPAARARVRARPETAGLALDSAPAPLTSLPHTGDMQEALLRAHQWAQGAHAAGREQAILACILDAQARLGQPAARAKGADGTAGGPAVATEWLLRGLPWPPDVQLAALLYLAHGHQMHLPHQAHLGHETDPLGQLLLREALGLVRQHHLLDTLHAPADAMAALCAAALRTRTETDTARALIARHRLQPTGVDSLHWPWPLKIYTLGRFGVQVDGTALPFSGKSPRKALELLQLLIASGGREVSTQLLMQGLWPDENHGNLRNLFDNTLHRLRRLIEPADALHMHNGKLGLDPALCWVDAWAFARLSAPCALPGLGEGGRRSPPLGEREARTAMRLYSGHFLGSEGDISWALAFRDRLRSRFHRLVITLGQQLEDAADWNGAIAVYERGLEVDNLSEVLYQHLMGCHLQRGEHAEALLAYRRCRDLLSIVLGVAPSERTEQLRRAAATARR